MESIDFHQLANLSRIAIQHPDDFESVLSQLGVPESEKWVYFHGVATALLQEYEQTDSFNDLVNGITWMEKALAVMPSESSYVTMISNNLGLALQWRFERTGSTEDLDRAIKANEEAVNATPVGHPYHPTFLSNLGLALHSQFERTGSMELLDRAIRLHRQAVEATPTDDPDHGLRLGNLGIVLVRQFERRGSMELESLDDAIKVLEQAIEGTPTDQPKYARFLGNLGTTFQTRFQKTGSIEDLDRSIEVIQRAVEALAVTHSDHARYLSNLGITFQLRFKRTGSLDDLDRAIEINGQAIEATPLTHPDRARRVSNLGLALVSRFERTGSIENIDRAIAAMKQALKATPVDHPDYAACLSNLGMALESRFERTRSMDDLDRAIETDQKAVEATRPDDPSLAFTFNNLGNAYQSRFEMTNSTEDLDNAIKANQKAVDTMPMDHPDRALCLSNLALAYHGRFERTGSIEALGCATEASELAAELVPVDHPNCAVCLHHLGMALESRFEKTGSKEDRDRAIDTRERAAKAHISPPSWRLKAARSCADFLIRQGRFSRAKPILEAAVHLLPKLAPRYLKQTDGLFNIGEFVNLTGRAVSLALEDKDPPYEALKLLELGRGILANLQLETRSDISILKAQHPELARRFEELRNHIDSPSTSSAMNEDRTSGVNVLPSITIKSQQSLVNQFDHLLSEIRSLPGFENFLNGPSETQMRSLATKGPIVVFNVSKIRSDAFLITVDQIRSIHLPLLTTEAVTHFGSLLWESIFEDATSLRRYPQGITKMNAVLQGLWDCGVKQVLEELGFTQMSVSGQPWPRVWWVASGLLSLLPIHAAGYHGSQNPSETVLDRVVSSYAFSVKTLAYAAEKASKSHRGEQLEAILIGMPTTPDQHNLPSVTKEITDIQSALTRSSIPVLVETDAPTRAYALSKLPNYGIVHFACHGISAQDPSQSRLLLQDWQTTPLTVSDLSSLVIESANFAYLSTCHSSAMRNLRLLDESINLSSAIQLCGYPSVVGSLWQLEASHSAEVAKSVYEWILGDNPGFDASRSSEGLHSAVRQLRDRTRSGRKNDDPLVWAPFIHVGL